MLKYLIIPLSCNAVSFCHYERGESDNGLIPLETLKKAIIWAMKENLNIQFLYPDTMVPKEYKAVIDSIDHTDIVSTESQEEELKNNADILVADSWSALNDAKLSGKCCVIRTPKNDLFNNFVTLRDALKQVQRLVVVITDINTFTEEDFKKYESFLDNLITIIADEYLKGNYVQLNLLSDRLFIDSMNNCNAGCESVTLAPDGKFYICPAFYLDKTLSVGDIDNGLYIKNPQLFLLNHAPICRICDAFQCRRCVWLNCKTTLEVNTPSHEQCVISHIERNASRKLLAQIRTNVKFLADKQIDEIDYIDPFETLTK